MNTIADSQSSNSKSDDIADGCALFQRFVASWDKINYAPS